MHPRSRSLPIISNIARAVSPVSSGHVKDGGRSTGHAVRMNSVGRSRDCNEKAARWPRAYKPLCPAAFFFPHNDPVPSILPVVLIHPPNNPAIFTRGSIRKLNLAELHLRCAIKNVVNCREESNGHFVDKETGKRNVWRLSARLSARIDSTKHVVENLFYIFNSHTDILLHFIIYFHDRLTMWYVQAG